MDYIFDKFTEWIKNLLVDGIMNNLSGLFDNVNAKVSEISTQIGSTPQAWEHLGYCDKRITFAPNINLTEEEKEQLFVIRDGITYLIIGNGKTFLHSVHYDENWQPPTETL